MIKYAIALVSLVLTATPAVAQTSTCKFLCEPTLLVEPTITWEKDATVFETTFALDLSTPIPRVGTLEAIMKPFNDENDAEPESELKRYWLEVEQTGNWLCPISTSSTSSVRGSRRRIRACTHIT